MIITTSVARTLAEEGTQMGPFRLYLNIEQSYRISYNGDDYPITTTGSLIEILKEVLPIVNWDSPALHSTVIIDVLYNWYNETNLKFRNGNIKGRFLTELARRINHDSIYANIFFNKLVAEGFDYAARYHTYKITNLHTNEEYLFVSSIYGKMDNNSKLLPRGINLAQLGYYRHPSNQAQYFTAPIEVVTYDGQSYYSSDLLTCTECGAKVPHLHAGICKDCLGIDPNLIVIREYSARAPDYLKYKIGKYSKETFKEPLFLGVELEYNTPNKDIALLHAARTLATHAIFKRDGSINNGFEIVTTPATLDEHLKEFSLFFGKINLFEAHQSCGMHVHISRKPLSKLTEGKLVEFMNREDNRNFIETIAGREANSYCRQDTDRTISYPFLNTDGARYNTLNINNRHTLEFRIFSSPKSFEDLKYKLEFVVALTTFCSPCNSTAKTLKDSTCHNSFLDFVKINKKDYPSLYKEVFVDEVKQKELKLNTYKVSQLNKGKSLCV